MSMAPVTTESQQSGLTSEAMLVPKGHPPTRVIQIRVAYATTLCHSETWERAVTGAMSGAHGPTVARDVVPLTQTDLLSYNPGTHPRC